MRASCEVWAVEPRVLLRGARSTHPLACCPRTPAARLRATPTHPPAVPLLFLQPLLQPCTPACPQPQPHSAARPCAVEDELAALKKGTLGGGAKPQASLPEGRPIKEAFDMDAELETLRRKARE